MLLSAFRPFTEQLKRLLCQLHETTYVVGKPEAIPVNTLKVSTCNTQLRTSAQNQTRNASLLLLDMRKILFFHVALLRNCLAMGFIVQ